MPPCCQAWPTVARFGPCSFPKRPEVPGLHHVWRSGDSQPSCPFEPYWSPPAFLFSKLHNYTVVLSNTHAMLHYINKIIIQSCHIFHATRLPQSKNIQQFTLTHASVSHHLRIPPRCPQRASSLSPTQPSIPKASSFLFVL